MIGKHEVIHIAKLAELAVSDEELPRLAEQLARIVSFVECVVHAQPFRFKIMPPAILRALCAGAPCAHENPSRPVCGCCR